MSREPTAKATSADAKAKAPVAPTMNVQTANALITGAPVTEEMLRLAMKHFAALETLLSISGPRFGNARSEAANMHNKAVARLRENEIERRLREARHRDAMSGLVEIKVD